MKTTIYSLCVILLLCITIRIPAQTADKTYCLTRTYTQPGGTSYTEEIRYLDGFGRDHQIIQRGASPQGNDIITPIAYGPFGCTERTYLPYARSSNNGAYYSNSLAAANWSAYGPADQAYAYGLSEYDHSPLNRVVKQTGPGAAWHTNSKGVSTVYGHNAAGEVRLYRIASNGSLTLDGTYAAGRLSKTTVTDEDGNSVITYVDNRDQTLLTVNIDGIDRLETYFVYDDRGQLRRVLSPEASSQLGTGIDASVLDKYAYRYEYDRFGRMSEKQLPGCAPVYMVYDQKDRLVLSQDGNQRTTNQWTYTLYDTKNRPVETGTVTLSGKNHTQLQTEAENSDNYLPSAPITANQYIAYDNYASTPHITAHPFTAAPGYAATFHTLTAGLETSVKTRVLGSDTWLTATYYYDSRCRLIHTVSDNLLGYKSRTYSQYDFTGNLTKQRETHQTSPGRTDIFEISHTYDQQGRLLSSTASLNNGNPATINYTYDELGRLTGKRYGNLPEVLSYNIRGWLTSKSSTPFRMQLRYDNPEGGAIPCYNGNLSEWEWQQGSNPSLLYSFTYDDLNRLTESIEKQKTGTSWLIYSGNSQEEGISYDQNGNLKTLKRKAHGTIVDNLTYTYTGNQLTTLTESAIVPVETDIYTRGNSADSYYTYDANGNMLTDSRRTLNFEYNFLNLVNHVTSGPSLKATYTWLADGAKLRVRDNGNVNGFDYLGSLTYRVDNGGLQLETADFGDGVIRPTVNGEQEIHYFLRDHLGSVRAIVNENGEAIERNDYYPFGSPRTVAGSSLTSNRLKYNGKELQTVGDLNFLDYGARMYDPKVGRWFGVDPMAEKRYGLSSYNYCGNNPVLLIDPDGCLETHYVDEEYNTILQTDDGSDDVVMVPADRMVFFLSVLRSSCWDEERMNSLGWNKFWKDEFGLADRQLNLAELDALESFNTKWSRNNAVSFLLNPTLGNALRMGVSEALSSWTNPELLVTGASVGMAGWQGIGGRVAKGWRELFKFTGTAAKHMDEAGRMIPIQILDDIIKSPMSVVKDIQGTNALMYYSQIWKNGKLYNVEVLYNKGANTIMHFKYTQNSLGSLPAIK